MKQRLDLLVLDRGLAPSREKARAMIMAGDIYVNGMREDKPGTAFPDDCEVEFRGSRLSFVSRGGLKLEKALQVFSLDPAGAVCLDIGASTGGFTDCLLQQGASRVYAVDVGHGQLDWKLRQDSRVVCLEKTNARYLTREQIPEEARLAGIDVSFISLELILPPVEALMAEDGIIVCLIKPQFEAGRDKVGKKGVVRDRRVHAEVIAKVTDFACGTGLYVKGLDFSPVRGPEGNIEFLLCLSKAGEGEPSGLSPGVIAEVTDRAHKELDEPG